MKLTIVLAVLALAVGPAAAQGMYGQAPNPYAAPQPYGGSYGGGYGIGSNPQSQGVQGYINQNGTYVQPYERTAPNNTQMDNYSTRGNQNPYTGAYGTRAPRY